MCPAGSGVHAPQESEIRYTTMFAAVVIIIIAHLPMIALMGLEGDSAPNTYLLLVDLVYISVRWPHSKCENNGLCA